MNKVEHFPLYKKVLVIIPNLQKYAGDHAEFLTIILLRCLERHLLFSECVSLVYRAFSKQMFSCTFFILRAKLLLSIIKNKISLFSFVILALGFIDFFFFPFDNIFKDQYGRALQDVCTKVSQHSPL